MNQLEKLPEITDRALNGLRADETLKVRILHASLQRNNHSEHIRFQRLVPLLLSSVALMILCVFSLNAKKPILPNENQQLIHSFSAGSSTSSNVSYDEFSRINSDSFEMIELRSVGKLTDRVRIDTLINLLKDYSEPISDHDFEMNDQLGFYGPSGLTYSVPVNPPYIGWSDGVRACDSFFESFQKSE